MKAMLDDKIKFEGASFELEVQSPHRSFLQRSAPALDGQVAIELGLRSRKIIQKGKLRAASENLLQKQIDELQELIDGNLHSLKCPDGRVFENLIIESFQVLSVVSGGAYKECQYTITYIQQVY